jgi:hypothetical protein
MTKLLRGDQVLEKLRGLGMDDLNDDWLNNMCRTKRLPYTLVGRYRRFREDEVDKVVAGWMDAACCP